MRTQIYNLAGHYSDRGGGDLKSNLDFIYSHQLIYFPFISFSFSSLISTPAKRTERSVHGVALQTRNRAEGAPSTEKIVGNATEAQTTARPAVSAREAPRPARHAGRARETVRIAGNGTTAPRTGRPAGDAIAPPANGKN